MALPTDERVMHLRRLAQRLQASPPSPERDELLYRTRLRVAEVEASDFDPPSSLPALANEPIPRF
jgi:hypothetical protein